MSDHYTVQAIRDAVKDNSDLFRELRIFAMFNDMDLCDPQDLVVAYTRVWADMYRSSGTDGVSESAFRKERSELEAELIMHGMSPFKGLHAVLGQAVMSISSLLGFMVK
jgi:hypothetical protein